MRKWRAQNRKHCSLSQSLISQGLSCDGMESHVWLGEKHDLLYQLQALRMILQEEGCKFAPLKVTASGLIGAEGWCSLLTPDCERMIDS